MEKMLFTKKQPEVSITILPDGKRDVRVLKEIPEESLTEETTPENTGDTNGSIQENAGEAATENSETIPEAYQYIGNQFRTVYPLTEDDILADKEKYLAYTAENEPTLEQIRHDQEITNAAIDSYTMELLEGGLL